MKIKSKEAFLQDKVDEMIIELPKWGTIGITNPFKMMMIVKAFLETVYDEGMRANTHISISENDINSFLDKSGKS